jgi:phosphoribosylglycinamide formyltransferase-1
LFLENGTEPFGWLLAREVPELSPQVSQTWTRPNWSGARTEAGSAIASVTQVRLGVLVSGSGTILEAMFENGLPVVAVLSDRPCAGLELARSHGAAAELVDRHDYGGFGSGFDRVAYTVAVTETLLAHQVDLVAMAGFGTVLSQAVHSEFPGRILNTHPALLPAFPGWHGVRDALAAGVKETGCTVHLATLDMDAGPILAQQVVAVLPDDTEETLHERIKVAERRLYPATVAWALGELEAGRSIEPEEMTL